MGFVNPILGGGGALVRPAIKSPGYVAGTSGWSVNRDGSAEFNNLSLRGTFTGTTYIQNASGLFIYSSTPAFGNLIATIAPAGGNDAFGNPYVPGVVSYDYASGHTFTQIVSGRVALGSITGGAPDTADAALLAPVLTGITNSATLTSGAGVPPNFDSAYLTLVCGQLGAVIGQPGAPYALLQDQNAASPADLHLSGAVIRTNLTGIMETWGTPSYTANFTGGSTSATYQPLQFRLDAEDNLHMAGAFHSVASTSSATVFALPAGYRPKATYAAPVASDSSTGSVQAMGCLLQFNTNGGVVLRTSTATAVGQNYYVNAKVPMGNLT